MCRLETDLCCCDWVGPSKRIQPFLKCKVTLAVFRRSPPLASQYCQSPHCERIYTECVSAHNSPCGIRVVSLPTGPSVDFRWSCYVPHSSKGTWQSDAWWYWKCYLQTPSGKPRPSTQIANCSRHWVLIPQSNSSKVQSNFDSHPCRFNLSWHRRVCYPLRSWGSHWSNKNRTRLFRSCSWLLPIWYQRALGDAFCLLIDPGKCTCCPGAVLPPPIERWHKILCRPGLKGLLHCYSRETSVCIWINTPCIAQKIYHSSLWVDHRSGLAHWLSTPCVLEPPQAYCWHQSSVLAWSIWINRWDCPVRRLWFDGVMPEVCVTTSWPIGTAMGTVNDSWNC